MASIDTPLQPIVSISKEVRDIADDYVHDNAPTIDSLTLRSHDQYKSFKLRRNLFFTNDEDIKKFKTLLDGFHESETFSEAYSTAIKLTTLLPETFKIIFHPTSSSSPIRGYVATLYFKDASRNNYSGTQINFSHIKEIKKTAIEINKRTADKEFPYGLIYILKLFSDSLPPKAIADNSNEIFPGILIALIEKELHLSSSRLDETKLELGGGDSSEIIDEWERKKVLTIQKASHCHLKTLQEEGVKCSNESNDDLIQDFGLQPDIFKAYDEIAIHLKSLLKQLSSSNINKLHTLQSLQSLHQLADACNNKLNDFSPFKDFLESETREVPVLIFNESLMDLAITKIGKLMSMPTKGIVIEQQLKFEMPNYDSATANKTKQLRLLHPESVIKVPVTLTTSSVGELIFNKYGQRQTKLMDEPILCLKHGKQLIYPQENESQITATDFPSTIYIQATFKNNVERHTAMGQLIEVFKNNLTISIPITNNETKEVISVNYQVKSVICYTHTGSEEGYSMLKLSEPKKMFHIKNGSSHTISISSLSKAESYIRKENLSGYLYSASLIR